MLLESEWRARLTASWMIACSRRVTYWDHLGELLLKSELTFAGQGYIVALASFGDDAAAEHLVRYLAHWLPLADRRYDQAWAMGALAHIDAAQRSDWSGQFTAPGGPWETWAGDGPTLAATRDRIARLVSLLPST